ncbi:hypothetical protein PVT71_07220 [Salipiger sp. H15]|uniref:Magnesium transporter MgtE intracellular domain-containing protein n=1 Tax=Alloyangia sp. H15 TaxID=3029062 RepID=A0AAU8ACS7_9RHOB
MKRFIAITALTSALATGAFAASEAQTDLINTYAPDVDVSALSEQQLNDAFSVANSGESDTLKRSTIESIAMTERAPSTFSAEQLAQIEAYLPSETVMMMTGEQRADALAMINSGMDDTELRGLLNAMGENMVPGLTPAEISRVETIAPEADLTVLSAEQVSRLRALIYTDESDGQIKGRVLDIVS